MSNNMRVETAPLKVRNHAQRFLVELYPSMLSQSATLSPKSWRRNESSSEATKIDKLLY